MDKEAFAKERDELIRELQDGGVAAFACFLIYDTQGAEIFKAFPEEMRGPVIGMADALRDDLSAE